MSMKNSGWWRRPGTSPAETTVPGALVDASTTSTSPRIPATSSRSIGLAPKRCGELERRLVASVGDVGDRRAARGEVRGGELAHPPGADEEDAPAAEVAEDLLRERGGGGRHRRGVLADRGLGPDALADLERLAEDPVEQRARARPRRRRSAPGRGSRPRRGRASRARRRRGRGARPRPRRAGGRRPTSSGSSAISSSDATARSTLAPAR